MILRRVGKFSAIFTGMFLPIAVATLLSTVAAAQKSDANAAAQQPQPAKSWQFEVAAIKPSDPKLPANSHSSWSGSLFQMENTPLKQWVEMGLSVQELALKAPSWLDTSRFDLKAKVPASAMGAKQDPRPEMMKALLIERFGLKWHEEIETVSGYELVPDKKVLAQPATSGGGSGSGPTSLSGKNMPMSKLAEMLGDVLRKPVVDATHLSGGFNIQVIYRAMDDTAVARAKGFGMNDADIDKLPSIFDAVREQLGLRLQSARVPSKIIVIDNINREPTAN